ncbi:MAG: L,D-transpeptidase [Phycisphaerae bacterium]|nr:L,D-transpeptidase [Phycisphaerae bacterium]
MRVHPSRRSAPPSRRGGFSLRRCLIAAGATAALGAAVGALGSVLAGTSAMAGSPGAELSDTVRDPRVVIVKHERALYLFDGQRLVKRYRIGLGRQPVGEKVHAGDDRTPLGEFALSRRNPDSRYHRFLGINYPNERAVRRGLHGGWISRGQAEALLRDLAEGRPPDQTTALGGGIGIHGGGNDRDWTAGCIAVTNDMIEELYAVLRVGDPVEILP